MEAHQVFLLGPVAPSQSQTPSADSYTGSFESGPATSQAPAIKRGETSYEFTFDQFAVDFARMGNLLGEVQSLAKEFRTLSSAAE
ncbi:hypothetical protein T439DRAFT_359230 [Meredithblackwellia eburnea MCA 4105]